MPYLKVFVSDLIGVTGIPGTLSKNTAETAERENKYGAKSFFNGKVNELKLLYQNQTEN